MWGISPQFFNPMKVIIPIAGKGTRARPHTYSKPKPFLPLAGKTAIDFLIEPILKLHTEEIIIVHDKYTEDFVKDFFIKKYPHINIIYVLQKDPKGTADAIYQAKPYINEEEDILIAYCDTIFKNGLSEIIKKPCDGVIFAVKVKDPENYGVLEHNEGVITSLVEKPKEPKSNLANIGLYYFKDGYTFINKYVKKVIDSGLNEKGEYYLTDAFLYMIEDGKKLLAEPIDYIDTGTVEKIIQANICLLDGKTIQGHNVQIENSEIGENFSIGNNTIIRNSKIKNSIIGSNSTIDDMEIEDSLIGDNVKLKKGKTFNIGDSCCIS